MVAVAAVVATGTSEASEAPEAAAEADADPEQVRATARLEMLYAMVRPSLPLLAGCRIARLHMVGHEGALAPISRP